MGAATDPVTVEGYTPGSPEWLRKMSASKVAAAVGLSPWTSPFTLWHQMAGNVPPDEESEAMRFGSDCEPMMRAWFTRTTGIQVKVGPAYELDGWMLATPDGECDCGGLLEIKTARDEWEWRDYHDDDTWTRALPAGYEVQVCWQLGVTGRDHAHIAVLFKQGCDRETFTVQANPDLFATLVRECRAFMDSLAAGVSPSIDASTNTYQALRHLNPDIDPEDIEIDPWLAWRIRTAKTEYDRADHALQAAKNEALHRMGNARRLTVNGQWVTRRQPNKSGISLYIDTRSIA